MLHLCALKSLPNVILIFFFRDLGVHLDGFIAGVAHTVVVGASKVSFAFVIILTLCVWLIFLPTYLEPLSCYPFGLQKMICKKFVQNLSQNLNL